MISVLGGLGHEDAAAGAPADDDPVGVAMAKPCAPTNRNRSWNHHDLGPPTGIEDHRGRPAGGSRRVPQRGWVLDVADSDEVSSYDAALHVLNNVNIRKRFYFGR